MANPVYDMAADNREYIYFVKYSKQNNNLGRGRLHFHNSVEFCFMINGSTRLIIDGAEYVISPGQIAYMDSFSIHDYHPDEDAEYYVVLISAEFFDGVNELTDAGFPPVMEGDKSFLAVKEFLDYSYAMWIGANKMIKFGFVNMLLGIMTSFYPTVKKSGQRPSEFWAKLLSYVNSHFQEDITLISIARRFGYSPNYLSTVFNRDFGISFRDYLNGCRITEFERLRKLDPTLPISTAAALSGFTSLNTFYRAYNKFGNKS